MSTYDIVYFKGNPSSGTPLQHQHINNEILEIIQPYSYAVLDSFDKNLSNIEHPKARVYIGFSRGSRYLSKLPSNTLRISIGGIRGNGIHLFKNKDDKIVKGDISESSLNAHFIIKQKDKINLKKLIENFCKN
ncbi:MAG: hypothetical protein HRT41_15265 [Campylobacteraceae bacterium]|nr:hypothetical protein [Campylobacteraceae bacterium]